MTVRTAEEFPKVKLITTPRVRAAWATFERTVNVILAGTLLPLADPPKEMLPGGEADAFQGPQLAEGGHAVIVAMYWPPLAFTFNVF